MGGTEPVESAELKAQLKLKEAELKREQAKKKERKPAKKRSSEC